MWKDLWRDGTPWLGFFLSTFTIQNLEKFVKQKSLVSSEMLHDMWDNIGLPGMI